MHCAGEQPHDSARIMHNKLRFATEQLKTIIGSDIDVKVNSRMVLNESEAVFTGSVKQLGARCASPPPLPPEN